MANPKSASKIITFLPNLLNWTARLTEIFDLPTPPLPLVTVISLAPVFDELYIVFSYECELKKEEVNFEKSKFKDTKLMLKKI